MKSILGAVLVIMFLSGCTTQRFTINQPIGPTGEPELETSQPFFVYGIGQTAVINAADVCGGADRIARIETEQTFLDGLITSLVGIIYTPRTARVYCLIPAS